MKTLKACLVILCLLHVSAVGTPQSSGANLFMAREIWKSIPGWPNYKASNLGLIKNNHRLLKQSIIKKGYLVVGLSHNGFIKQFKAHRLVMFAFKGVSHLDVHHVNEIKTDNRLSNLRYCTQRQNVTWYHKKRKSSSKYMGVSWHSRAKIWHAQIHIKGKKIHLGDYRSEYKAHLAYKAALKKIE